MKLLSVSNTKLEKGRSLGFETYGLSLAPANLAGGPTVCPNASPACKAACLYYAGMGVFSNVQKARIEKTRFYLTERKAFIEQLKKEIGQAIKQAQKQKLRAVFRLNVLSDIRWEETDVISSFPETPFYDYTKNAKTFEKALPSNYSLTFSRSEINEVACIKLLKRGANVAAVFRNELPPEWNDFRVVDGDKNDLRFLDPSGVVVGLRAKGKAKNDKTGFVIG